MSFSPLFPPNSFNPLQSAICSRLSLTQCGQTSAGISVQMIGPVADALNIPRSNIEANNLLFNERWAAQKHPHPAVLAARVQLAHSACAVYRPLPRQFPYLARQPIPQSSAVNSCHMT